MNLITPPKPFVYVIRDVVQATSDNVLPALKMAGVNITADDINYRFGSWLEITQKLDKWAQSPTMSSQRLPMIALIENITKSSTTDSDYRSVTCDIVIAIATRPNYDSFNRQINSFDPILYPIYNELIKQIAICQYFPVLNPLRDIPHTQIDDKMLGVAYSNANKTGTNTYLDAIIIKNLKLKTLKQVL